MGCETRCRGYCPCERLRRLGVEVVEAPTPPGELGYFDPDTRRVVIRPGLQRSVKRSTLAHEAVHVEVHDAAEPTWWHEVDAPYREECTEEVAVRESVSLSALVDVLATGRTIEAVASALDVDPAAVRARVATLTPAERRYVERRLHSAVVDVTGPRRSARASAAG